MAVKQLPKISDLPEPPDRLVGDQERFDVLTFNSLKAQKKMVNDDLNKTLIPDSRADEPSGRRSGTVRHDDHQ